MLLAAVCLLTTIVSSVRLNPVVDIVGSHKLLVNKTEKAVVGQPFNLSCSLQTSGELEHCSWSRAGGAEMMLQQGELLDHQRREISVVSQDRK